MIIWARALYDYEAQESDELEVRKGDLIRVESRDEENWWIGRIGERSGEFPSNYVEVVTEGMVDDYEPAPPPVSPRKAVEKSPLLRKGRAVVEQATSEREEILSEDQQNEEDYSEEDSFVENESVNRLQEAAATMERIESSRRVSFSSSSGGEAATQALEARRQELEEAASIAEARREEAELALEKARALRVEEEEKTNEMMAIRRREESAAAVARESTQTAIALAASTAAKEREEYDRSKQALNETIRRIIDERIQAEFEKRDAIVDDIRLTMARLQDEMRTKAAIVAEHHLVPKSSRSEGDAVKLSPKMSCQSPSKMLCSTPRKKKLLKLPSVPPDSDDAAPPSTSKRRRRLLTAPAGEGGVASPEFDENLPRVANLQNGSDRAKQAKQAKELRELATKAAVRYSKCKSVVFAPEKYSSSNAPPDSDLALEYAYGYSGEARRKVQIGCNAVWSLNGQRALYPTAGLVVAHDLSTNTQTFFEGHAETGEPVTAIVRHPFQDVYATGQAGRRPRVCVWTLTEDATSSVADLQLPSGSRFVSLIRFSPCGNILLTLGSDEGHTFTLWDWQKATPVLTQRAGASPVFALDFHPTLVVLAAPSKDERTPRLTDLGPGDAHYAFVSCGYRCIKFWTLTLDQEASVTPAKIGSGSNSPSKKKLSSLLKKWKCDGYPATAGRAHHHEMQNVTFTALAPVVVESALTTTGDATAALSPRSTDEPTFVPDACYVVGTDHGAIALWQQAEDEDVTDEDIRWLPRGRCLAVAKSVHEGAVLALAVSRGRGAARPPRVTSAGKDGQIKVMLLVAASSKRPVELVGQIVVSSQAPILGAPRSLCIDGSETKLLVGTNCNALAVVSLPNPEDTSGDVARPKGSASDAALKAAFAETARRAAASHSQLALQIFAHGHVGRVNQIAAHPTLPLIASVGADKTLRLWDTVEHRLAQLLRLSERALTLAFDPSGVTLALGCENGDVLLATCENSPATLNSWSVTYKRRVTASKRIVSAASAATEKTHKKLQGSVDDNSAVATTPSPPKHHDDEDSFVFSHPHQHNAAVLAVAFSPDGSKLAAACADKCIHVFGENYKKRLFVLKGHSSVPCRFDFDESSSIIQSNDLGHEVMFWDVASGKQHTNAYLLRNTKWNTWTCALGWSVHGIDYLEEVRAVARSNNSDVVLAPGPRNTLRLTRFPTLPGAIPKTFHAHSKQVSTLTFSRSDDMSYSAGGSDASLIQWRHQQHQHASR